jgi:carbon starvation protein
LHERAREDEARALRLGHAGAHAWLLITTLTAGVQKIFDPESGNRLPGAGAQVQRRGREGTVIAPAKSIAEMQRVAFNNYLDAAVCAFFVLLVSRCASSR